jgi:hypothetical protein
MPFLFHPIPQPVENPMSKSNAFLSTLFAGALLLGASALRADEGHDHSKHDHAKEAIQKGAPMSSHDGMASLYKHLGEMEKELSAGSVDGIHGHDEAIQASVKDLDKDTALTAAGKQRVQGYVKNVLKLAGKLHAAADGKKLDQANADFRKLKAQVDLLDKQFTHSHKPGAGNVAKEEGAHSHHGK